MKIFYGLAFGLIGIFSCKSSTDKVYDQVYEDLKTGIKDSNEYQIITEAQILQNLDSSDSRRKEGEIWLAKIDSANRTIVMEDKKNYIIDSMRLNKMGKWTLLKLDDCKKKCNLKEAYYLLETKKNDSSDLAFAAHLLAEELFISFRKDNQYNDCDYPNMSSVFIYSSTKDYYNNDPMAGCNISPSDYQGRPFVLKK